MTNRSTEKSWDHDAAAILTPCNDTAACRRGWGLGDWVRWRADGEVVMTWVCVTWRGGVLAACGRSSLSELLLLLPWFVPRGVVIGDSPPLVRRTHRHYALADYADWVTQEDPSRLKFLDESQFKNWDCSRWQWCRGPRGERMNRARHMVERARKTFSVTYMTSLTHPRGGVLLSVREGSNNDQDYIEALVDAAYHGHLQDGDTLVVDNVRIHGAQEWREI